MPVLTMAGVVVNVKSLPSQQPQEPSEPDRPPVQNPNARGLRGTSASRQSHIIHVPLTGDSSGVVKVPSPCGLSLECGRTAPFVNVVKLGSLFWFPADWNPAWICLRRMGLRTLGGSWYEMPRFRPDISQISRMLVCTDSI